MDKFKKKIYIKKLNLKKLKKTICSAHALKNFYIWYKYL